LAHDGKSLHSCVGSRRNFGALDQSLRGLQCMNQYKDDDDDDDDDELVFYIISKIRVGGSGVVDVDVSFSGAI
jgi:hypothetical protein